MREEFDCEYKTECRDAYPEEEMDRYREKCDCVTCALCDRYWLLYDRAHLEQIKRRQDYHA